MRVDAAMARDLFENFAGYRYTGEYGILRDYGPRHVTGDAVGERSSDAGT